MSAMKKARETRGPNVFNAKLGSRESVSSIAANQGERA
jgi:hypothetical protein